jgi:HNH endonuclease
MKICPTCKTAFETIYPDKVYCSAICQQRARDKRRSVDPEERAKRAAKQRVRQKGYQERMKADSVFKTLFRSKANERARKHYQAHYVPKPTKLCKECGEPIAAQNKKGICKFCISAAKDKRLAERKAVAKYPFFKFFYQRYLARKSGLRADFTRKDWVIAVEHFNGCCAYCGRERELHQDHFVPSTKGGGYTKKNIVPACQTCNSRKGNKHPSNWLPVEKYLKIVRYLNGL